MNGILVIILAVIALGGVVISFLLFLSGRKIKSGFNEKLRLLSIQEKNNNDNIRIASKITNAIIPTHDVVKKILSDYFIVDIPRDTVSGDFYFIKKQNEKSVIVVADCTGHDISGAFLRLLGIVMLNEIIQAYPNASASEIIDKLRPRLTSFLLTDLNEDNSYNIDLSVCIIDHQKNELQYSGARNSVFLIRDNEITEISGDKMPLVVFSFYSQPFQCQDLKLKKNDMLYMFTDGFHDQFGGPNKKKFGKKHFKELLLDIHQKPLDVQSKELENAFNNWKADFKKVDDVLILGIKI